MSSRDPLEEPDASASGSDAPAPRSDPPSASVSPPAPGSASGAVRPAARLVVAITQGDVGARVSVRYRLPVGEAASLSDVVGVLTGWGHDDVLHVRRRDGSTALVARADVVAAKVVPPAPPPRR